MSGGIKNYKCAFTIAELVLSLIVLGVVAICSLNVAFNKNKMQKRVAADTNQYYLCYEGINDIHGVYNTNIDGKGNGGCDFYISPILGVAEGVPASLIAKEFITVTLTGGGAGMGLNRFSGNPGEEKEIHIPSLATPRPIGEAIPDTSKCASPMCSECDSEGLCTKCITGYKLEGDGCRVNFKYRAILGKGGAVGKNGGQTSLLMVSIEADGSTPADSVLGVVETASGGFTSSQLPSDVNGDEQKTTGSENGSGNGGYSGSPAGKSGEVKIQW